MSDWWFFAWAFQSAALQRICHTSTGYNITGTVSRYSAYDVIVYVRSQALYRDTVPMTSY